VCLFVNQTGTLHHNCWTQRFAILHILTNIDHKPKLACLRKLSVTAHGQLVIILQCRQSPMNTYFIELFSLMECPREKHTRQCWTLLCEQDEIITNPHWPTVTQTKLFSFYSKYDHIYSKACVFHTLESIYWTLMLSANQAPCWAWPHAH